MEGLGQENQEEEQNPLYNLAEMSFEQAAAECAAIGELPEGEEKDAKVRWFDHAMSVEIEQDPERGLALHKQFAASEDPHTRAVAAMGAKDIIRNVSPKEGLLFWAKMLADPVHDVRSLAEEGLYGNSPEDLPLTFDTEDVLEMLGELPRLFDKVRADALSQHDEQAD
jgi:hypothetical protein